MLLAFLFDNPYHQRMTPDDHNEQIYSVSQLTHLVQTLLQDEFPPLWLSGEISNLVKAASGHLYFSIKDQQSQVRCAMFRHTNRRLTFTPKNGEQVLIKGQVSLYEPRGDFQIIAQQMQQAGAGALQQAFLALREKLTKEGLFVNEHKQTIPSMPKKIAVVTSPTGAAIRDILTTLKRRFPAIPVIIYPCLVQGKKAAGEIVRSIELANQRAECDVLILARGGGSLEDLWPFNEEIVARSIFTSKIPTVSAVGHETDFTIADFVADQRAPTPTAAAELCSPEQITWQRQYQQHYARLSQLITQLMQQKQQTIDYLQKRLIDPRQRLAQQAERLSFLSRVLNQAMSNVIKYQHNQLQQQTNSLLQCSPAVTIGQLRERQKQQTQRLHYSFEQLLNLKKSNFNQLVAQLDAISPLATLSRGYALVTKSESEQLITQAEQVQVGDLITTKLAKGTLQSEVKQKA